MARTGSYLGSPKAIANLVAQTLTWTSSEIDSTGVTGFTLGLQPVGNTIAIVDRVRVRAAGQVILEMTLAQLLAYQASYSRANFADATTGTKLYIPLNMLDGPTMEARDQCQFPPGAEAQVEIVLLATAVTGTAVLGWTISTQVPRFFPRILTSSSNITAAANKNAKFLFSESGIIRAIGFDTRGVDRAELTVSGQRAWNLPGAVFQGLAYGDLLAEKDVSEFGDAVAATQNYRYHAVDLLIPGANGSTNLILDTTAAWPGTTSEISVYAVDEVKNFRGRA